MHIRNIAYLTCGSPRWPRPEPISSMRTMNRMPIPVALALVPMQLALLGAAFDERTHRGYTTWLSACRATGPTIRSLVVFTVELLPVAVMGMLVGVLLVQLAGVWFRLRAWGVPSALAAHGGCVFGMTVGLLLCTLTLPLPLLLGVETLLTAAGAWFLYTLLQRRIGEASLRRSARSLASAQ